MNIRMETAGPCRREVHIEVPAERVKNTFEEITSLYARSARIPGFRPGRAPRDLIRRRYQKEIADDVKERLIPEGYQAAVKQEKLTTVAVLDVTDQKLEEDQPFIFSVVVDVAPEIALPQYKGIPLTRKTVVVTDADVEKVAQNIREHNARFEDVSDRAVGAGDMVQIDYKGVCEGQPISTIAPEAEGLGEAKDFWIIADEQNEFLPGFAKGLLGAIIGEAREIQIDFAPVFQVASLAGKKATYFVQITAIREKKLPEINEEFFKKFGLADAQEFHARIREDLENTNKREENDRLRGEIVRFLLDNANFDAPESVLQEETRQQVYDLVRRNQSRGVSAEEIEQKKEEMFDSATRSATEKVKLRYLLGRIADEEKITVTDRELDDQIRIMAYSWRTSFEKLRADLIKQKALDQVREDVLGGKVADFLMSQAVVTEEGAVA